MEGEGKVIWVICGPRFWVLFVVVLELLVGERGKVDMVGYHLL